MTATDIGRAYSLRDAPRKIILPSTVANCLQGAFLDSAKNPKHFEEGGAIFARKTQFISHRTQSNEVIASEDAFNVDRTAPQPGDVLVMEYHTHPRSLYDRSFEWGDPPSSFDYDHFARVKDRLLLVRAQRLTYGLLKTKEYDRRFPPTAFYQQDLSFYYRQVKREALAEKCTFSAAISRAAIRVAKRFNIAFYVGGPTTLGRIDDRVK
jgi:hypothetical protein